MKKIFCYLLLAASSGTVTAQDDPMGGLRFHKGLPDATSEELAAMVKDIHHIKVDGFLISDDQRRAAQKKIGSNINGIIDEGQSWFYNAALNEALVCDIGTDYTRASFYQFRLNDVPDEVVDFIGLYEAPEAASLAKKKVTLPKFVKTGKPLSAKIRISDNGIKLGDDKASIDKLYGVPDSTALVSGIDRYEWWTHSDETIQLYGGLMKKNIMLPKHISGDERSARDIMFFKDGKLMARIVVMSKYVILADVFNTVFKK